MSTSFYLRDAGTHIGKRSSMGKQGLRFTWALDPVRVGYTCGRASETEFIVDVYGKFYTGEEFIEQVIDAIAEHDYSLIGKEFS